MSTKFKNPELIELDEASGHWYVAPRPMTLYCKTSHAWAKGRKWPQILWLEPQCDECAGFDRQWCQDDAWGGGCDVCGRRSTPYRLQEENTHED